jgi:hypothetical protein
MATMERGETMEHPPGLRGTYEGACAICLQGCDTALVFEGEAEWIVAGLMTLGIRDYDEAVAVLSQFTGCDLGMVPNGTVTVGIQCCEACVAKSSTGMRVGLVASGALPCYRPQR